MKKLHSVGHANRTSLTVDGVAVRTARKAARLSQAQVAQRMNYLGYSLPQPYVCRVEMDTCPHSFTEPEVTALAAVLGVGISEIANCRLLMNHEVGRVHELTSELDGLLGRVAS